ncbi:MULTISPECIES: hypothetical protein [Paenibacillus]|uniref:hypothetical protein n=1 Tax=Paenibacillus sp. FSL F4-0100 TaxID=2921370 RepID=UPI0015C3E264|nr:hypothetical protein [Paenibacillus lautus]
MDQLAVHHGTRSDAGTKYGTLSVSSIKAITLDSSDFYRKTIPHLTSMTWRLSKVRPEVGWLSLTHNLLKKAAIDQNKEMTVQGCSPLYCHFFICNVFFHKASYLVKYVDLLLGQPHCSKFYLSTYQASLPVIRL